MMGDSILNDSLILYHKNINTNKRKEKTMTPLKQLLSEILPPVLEEKEQEIQTNPNKYRLNETITREQIEGMTQKQRIDTLYKLTKDIGIDINHLIHQKV